MWRGQRIFFQEQGPQKVHYSIDYIFFSSKNCTFVLSIILPHTSAQSDIAVKMIHSSDAKEVGSQQSNAPWWGLLLWSLWRFPFAASPVLLWISWTYKAQITWIKIHTWHLWKKNKSIHHVPAGYKTTNSLLLSKAGFWLSVEISEP